MTTWPKKLSPASVFLGRIRNSIQPYFRWYYLWMGVYIDTYSSKSYWQAWKVYIGFFPCLGIKIDLARLFPAQPCRYCDSETSYPGCNNFLCPSHFKSQDEYLYYKSLSRIEMVK